MSEEAKASQPRQPPRVIQDPGDDMIAAATTYISSLSPILSDTSAKLAPCPKPMRLLPLKSDLTIFSFR
jgi:hypothetical protein